MRKSRRVYITLSAALSIFLLWYLFSQIKAEDLTRTLSRIYYPPLFAYMAVNLMATWLRAWRYKWLLQPQAIGWGNIFMVTFIRNCFDDLLPARIGSLSYIYVLNRRLNFPFESATSTFVVAFVFDFLTLSPFLILALLAVGFGSAPFSGTSLLFLSLLFFLAIFIILWKLVPLSRFLLKIYQAFLTALKVHRRKWANGSVEKAHVILQSLSQIQARKIYFPLFFLSLLIRLGKYVSIYFLLFALLRSHGFSLQNLSIWKTILGLTGAELTSALPIKGIAGFGTWESAWAFSFKLMNFEPRLAILSGITIHLLTNLFEYSLGIVSIAILALPLVKKWKRRNPIKI
ncbi:MAG: lysylphosphatidylglycerol synthase transmembrane domain-containing protein [Candidatus Aminicenantales bacterium]